MAIDSATAVEKSLRDLMDRLTREANRRPQKGAVPTTERVGGVSKLGQELEAFLKAVLRHVSELSRVSERELLQRAQVPCRDMDKATLGVLIQCLAAVPHEDGPCAALIDHLVADSKREHGALKGFLRVRNGDMHAYKAGNAPDDRERSVRGLLELATACRIKSLP